MTEKTNAAIKPTEIPGHKFYVKFMEFGSELHTDFRFTNVTNVLEKTKLINKGGFYAF